MEDDENTVSVNLLFFAKSREVVGLKQAHLSLPDQTTGKHILTFIIGAFPSLEQLVNQIILSVNEQYIDRDTQVRLRAGDVIAIIPPLSGG